MKYKWGGIPKKIGIPDLNKKDAITVVGKSGLKVATYVKETYNELLSDGFLSTDISTDGFVNNKNNLERGDSWGRQLISIVKTESMTSGLLQDFKCPNDKLKLTAFLILHATGHNAGIGHFEGVSDIVLQSRLRNDLTDHPPGYSYMMSGSCILSAIGATANCNDLSYQELKIFGKKMYYSSLEDLISQENISPSNKILHQDSLIRQRFEW